MSIELDGRKQYLLHHIFKIDQKSLSKLFMASQETFTYSKSTREILEVDVVLTSLFLTLNIIYNIFESLLLTDRKIFVWIVSSNYETISIFFKQQSVVVKYTYKLHHCLK